jgi:hypothetical protein
MKSVLDSAFQDVWPRRRLFPNPSVLDSSARRYLALSRNRRAWTAWRDEVTWQSLACMEVHGVSRKSSSSRLGWLTHKPHRMSCLPVAAGSKGWLRQRERRRCLVNPSFMSAPMSYPDTSARTVLAQATPPFLARLEGRNPARPWGDTFMSTMAKTSGRLMLIATGPLAATLVAACGSSGLGGSSISLFCGYVHVDAETPAR